MYLSTSKTKVAAAAALFPLAALLVSPASQAAPLEPAGTVALADGDGDGVLEAPTSSGAAKEAETSGDPVEDLSQRTGAVTVVANPDGTWTRTDTGEPSRVLQGSVWKDIDLDLVRTDDGDWKPKTAPVAVSVSNGGGNDAARIAFAPGKSLTVGWPEDLPEPTVDGPVATYKLSEAADLLVGVTTRGASVRIRLNERPDQTDDSFKLELQADGLDIEQTGNGLSITDQTGKTVASTTQLAAWDAETDAAGDPKNIVDVDADLETAPASAAADYTLDLAPEDGFLADPRTTYPAIIDPDISSLSRIRDTWTLEGNTTTHGLDYRLITGKIATSGLSGDARSYLQFNTDALDGKKVIDATLNLYQYFAKTCSARSLLAQPLGTTWDPNILHTNRPSVRAGTGDTTTITTNKGYTGCSGGTVPIDVTNMVDAWAAGTYPDYGIWVGTPTANATDASYERRFCSFNPDTTSDACYNDTRRPTLSVTYNTPPTISTASPSVTLGTDPQVTLGATATDPDGTAPWVEFTIKRGTTIVHRGLSTASSGSVRSLTLNGLPKGAYTVTARAYDGRHFSTASSAASAFTISTDVTTVLGDSFTKITTPQAETVTLPPAVTEGTEVVPSETFVEIYGDGIPEDVVEGLGVALNIQASGWTGSGTVSVSNADAEDSDPAKMTLTTSMNPDVARTSTRVLTLSEDSEVVLRNTTLGAVQIDVSALATYTLAPPEVPAPIDGPNVALQVIEDAPTGSSVDLQFTPPLTTPYTLTSTSGGRITLATPTATVGNYTATAVDAAGQVVPTATAVGGQQFTVTVTPPTDATYPISVAPTFEAGDPTDATTQSLYPDAEDLSVIGDDELPQEAIVEAIDEAGEEFVEDLKTPEEGDTSTAMAARAAPQKVRVPHWRRSNGTAIIPKNYVYDPRNRQGRNPARKGWHDYCTGKPYFATPDSMAYYRGPFGARVSYKGPCARHDLCIQFKQAPHRSYCDTQFKADLRQNCRYFLRNAGYYRGVWYSGPYTELRNSCYRWAGRYYSVVRRTTNSKTDSGKWGHSQYQSVYPTYRYNVW